MVRKNRLLWGAVGLAAAGLAAILSGSAAVGIAGLVILSLLVILLSSNTLFLGALRLLEPITRVYSAVFFAAVVGVIMTAGLIEGSVVGPWLFLLWVFCFMITHNVYKSVERYRFAGEQAHYLVATEHHSEPLSPEGIAEIKRATRDLNEELVAI